MPILTTQFPDVVKNALVLWREGYKSVPYAARQMYDIRNVTNMNSEHSSISGYGFAKRKNEGEKYAYGSIKQGYSMTLSQKRIGVMDAITWEARKYDKYREIEKKMRKLGESTAKTIERDLTLQFSQGMSAASYTDDNGETVSCATADGQNFFDTDHTITGGSSTYSNLITAAFSRSGLEEAENTFKGFVDDNGNAVLIEPDTIICGRNVTVQNQIKEFLKSTLVPDEANNATNVYAGKYKTLVLPFLNLSAAGAPVTTYDNFWYLASLKNTDAICEISEEPTFKAPSAGGNGEDFETDDWKFKSSASYDYGVLDYKWIVGSTGATN